MDENGLGASWAIIVVGRLVKARLRDRASIRPIAANLSVIESSLERWNWSLAKTVRICATIMRTSECAPSCVPSFESRLYVLMQIRPGSDDVPIYIYIAGRGHSGSTLLTLLLARHPRGGCRGRARATCRCRLARDDTTKWVGECSCGERPLACPMWGEVLGRIETRGERRFAHRPVRLAFFRRRHGRRTPRQRHPCAVR